MDLLDGKKNIKATIKQQNWLRMFSVCGKSLTEQWKNHETPRKNIKD